MLGVMRELRIAAGETLAEEFFGVAAFADKLFF